MGGCETPDIAPRVLEDGVNHDTSHADAFSQTGMIGQAQRRMVIGMDSKFRITSECSQSMATGGTTIVYAGIEVTEHIFTSDDIHMDDERITYARIVPHSDWQKVIEFAVGDEVASSRISAGEMGESFSASKRRYELLPRTILAGMFASSFSDGCDICREASKTGDTIVTIFCGHALCEDCLHEWFSNHDPCPRCRLTLPMGSIYHEVGQMKEWRARPNRAIANPVMIKFDWVHSTKQSVGVLRFIMQVLCIPNREGHHIEKMDLVDAIADSHCVEMIAPRMEGDSDGKGVNCNDCSGTKHTGHDPDAGIECRHSSPTAYVPPPIIGTQPPAPQ